MKFKEYLKEITGTIAFWISPKGQVYGGNTEKHINMIFQNPKKFGFTQEQVDKTYEKFDEPKGVEGKAREELVVSAIKKGFIRIRRYVNKFYSVNVYDYNEKAKDHLFGWALDLISGKLGEKESDIYMPGKIDSARGHAPRNITLADMAKGKHMNENKQREDVDLIFVNSIEEFDDYEI